MMDRSTVQLVESSIYAAGYPTEAAAVLLVELDGRPAAVAAESRETEALCRAAGATEVRSAATPPERERLWQGRKKAFGALGRASADLVVQDAVVPRSSLPEVLERIGEIAARHRLRVSNVFHAGDGNLHPNLSFDAGDPDQVRRVHEASAEIMRLCVEAGGSITGEHGVGLDKLEYMPLIFGPDDLGYMTAVRRAFDPDGRANPGKVVPTAQCNEWRPWGST
jgi:FAD/FMN-containing dehydrogenase